MSDLPIIGQGAVKIIGQAERKFTLVFHKEALPNVKSFVDALRFLMIAFPTNRLDGNVDCLPAIIALWQSNVQQAVQSGAMIECKREDLVSIQDANIEFSITTVIQENNNSTTNDVIIE